MRRTYAAPERADLVRARLIGDVTHALREDDGLRRAGADVRRRLAVAVVDRALGAQEGGQRD